MIRGIGIDSAGIVETGRLAREVGAFKRRTFTEAERAAAPEGAHARDEYFAVRFAAKEAVFKAIAHLLPERSFDLRIVETLNHEDGAPHVNVTPELAEVLATADVDLLHISATTENDLATVFVVAEKR